MLDVTMTMRMNMKTMTYKAKPKIVRWIVWRLPRSIVYWSAIRLMAHATQGPYSNQVVPELLAMDALERWDK